MLPSKSDGVDYKGEHEAIIDEITFKGPNGEGESVKFEFEESNGQQGLITITSEVALDVGGIWSIILKDIFGKEYTITFTVLNKIEHIVHQEVFVFDNENKSFDVEFDVAITDLTIFTLITTQSNVQSTTQTQFTIQPKENDTTNKVFTLTLTNTKLFTTIPSQLNLYFYGENNKIVATTPITIVPSSKAPYKFKQTKGTITRYAKELSFEFASTETIFTEFTEQITIKNDISTCTVVRILQKKLYLQCDSFEITGEFIYGYYFGGKKLNEFTITVTEHACVQTREDTKLVYDPQSKICKSCSEIDGQKPLYYNHQCYEQCPPNTINYGNECYTSCLAVQGKILYQEGEKCVEQCETGYKYNYKCVGQCESHLYTDYVNQECVQECPHNTYIYSKGCYSSCEIAERTSLVPLLTNGYVCEKNCFDEFSYKNECYKQCNEINSNMYGENGICKHVSECIAYSEEENKCYGNCTQSQEQQLSLFGAKSPVKCYKECPKGTGQYEKLCYSSCKQFGMVLEQGKCEQFCLSERVVYNGVCYDSCKDAPAANLFENQQSECVSRCPEGTYGSNYKCVEKCPAFTDREKGLCVSQCDSKKSYQKVCVSDCSNVDGQRLLYNEQTLVCEEQCSSGTHQLGDSCVAKCPLKLDKTQNKCVAKCKSAQFTEGKDGKICYDKCPAGLKAKDDICVTDNECANLGYVIDGDECVKSCPEDKFKQRSTCVESCGNEFEFDGECYDTCGSAKKAKKHDKLFISEDNKKCVKKCPYSYDGPSGKCIKCNLSTHFMVNDECVEIKPDKGNCGRCHEQGSHHCNENRAENKNKECDCNAGYTGISCGYYVGEGEDEDEEIQKERIHDVLDSIDFESNSEESLYRIEDCTQVIKDLGTQPQMEDIANDSQTKEKCREIVENSINKIQQGTDNLKNNNGNGNHQAELEIGGLAVTAELVALTGGNGNGNNVYVI